MNSVKTKIDNSIIKEILMELILKIDGSTTLALETVIGAKVSLEMFYHDRVENAMIPKEVLQHFDGHGPFMKRQTALMYNGEKLSDNLVFCDLSCLPNNIAKELELGKIPIGKLINKLEHHRKIFFSGYKDSEDLPEHNLAANYFVNRYPVKKYTIINQDKAWFYVSEIFYEDTILKHVDNRNH